jgi:hypothetical protein
MTAIVIHETMHLQAYLKSRKVEEGCEDPGHFGRAVNDSCVMRAQRPWLERFGLDPFPGYGSILIADASGRY